MKNSVITPNRNTFPDQQFSNTIYALFCSVQTNIFYTASDAKVNGIMFT